MAALLNFGGTCTYNPKNTMGDKLKLINDMTSQCKCECHEIYYYSRKCRNVIKSYNIYPAVIYDHCART